jgi:3',5'-cyclic AMP phosphodiesterase CpdA
MRTIVQISDLHFDAIEPAVVAALPADIARHEPSLLVVSGDFTQRARAGQYRRAMQFLAKLPKPQLVIPGNHDIPLFNLIRRFFFPLGRYCKFVTGDLRPVFRDAELLVMGINTARPFAFSWNGFWKDGRISEEQLLDIELRAKDVEPEVFRVVVTHHPFIPPPGERIHGIVHGARRALAEMERHHIDLLLAGHLHMGYSGDVRTHHEAVKRSILSVQAGTATSTRRRGEANAYNVITINPDHVTVQVRKWDGSAFINGDRTHFSRIDGVWQREG